MKELNEISGYSYSKADLGCAHEYVLPRVTDIVAQHFQHRPEERRLFDLGCGNGSVASHFAKLGYAVTGIDASAEGVAVANAAFPEVAIAQGSAYDDLASTYGTFPAVISLEVVEHLYAPRQFARTMFGLVESGGIAVISTPYHGYWKNIAVVLANHFDQHVDPLWDHGHIKFWSIRTLTRLLDEAGFKEISFHRVGRIPLLAKSMIAVARKH